MATARQADKEFGVRFKAARKARGLTVEEVAKAVELSVPTVLSWEKGKRRPSDPQVKKLGAALRMPGASILSGSLMWDKAISGALKEQANAQAAEEKPVAKAPRRAVAYMRPQFGPPPPPPPPKRCKTDRGCPVTLGWCIICKRDVDNMEEHLRRPPYRDDDEDEL